MDVISRRLELLKLEGLGFSQAEIMNELSQNLSKSLLTLYLYATFHFLHSTLKDLSSPGIAYKTYEIPPTFQHNCLSLQGFLLSKKIVYEERQKKEDFAGDAYREDDVCAGSWGMFRLLWLLKNVEDKTKKRVKFYPTHTNLSY